MAHYLVRTDSNEYANKIVEDFNDQINSSNPVFMLFQGKASLLTHDKEQYIFFNIRVNPFEIPFYKYVSYLTFKRMTKKKGYKAKFSLCSNKELERVLEAYL